MPVLSSREEMHSLTSANGVLWSSALKSITEDSNKYDQAQQDVVRYRYFTH